MAETIAAQENHYKLQRLAAGMTLALLGPILLGACDKDNSGGGGGAAPTPVETATSTTSVIDILQGEQGRLNGYVNAAQCAAEHQTDRDCDGVLNQYDLIPWGPDFGDADGDGVINAFDTNPFIKNSFIDSDGDGIADSFDTYRGNNFADNDHDLIYAAFDTNDNLPAANRAQQDIRLQQGTQIVKNAMGRQIMGEILSHDTNIISASIVAEQSNPFVNDADGDGDPDYWDTARNDGSVTEFNDPYSSSSNQWTNDAYNGWGSE